MEFICKDYNTTIYSLAQVIGVSQGDIAIVLKQDWEIIYEKEHDRFINHGLPKEDFIDDFGEFILFKGFPNAKIAPIRPTVHWFHGARTTNPNDYLKLGILPLSEMYPKIKYIVDSIAASLNLKASKCTSDIQKLCKSQIDMKLSDSSIHGGPFAMLMYEASAKAKYFDNYNYIDMPEIIVDYAYMKYGQKANSILEEFRRISSSIIVEFIEPHENDTISIFNLITTAIIYLYCKAHNKIIGCNGNICFTNKGKPILSNLIVNIHKI